MFKIGLNNILFCKFTSIARNKHLFIWPKLKYKSKAEAYILPNKSLARISLSRPGLNIYETFYLL